MLADVGQGINDAQAQFLSLHIRRYDDIFNVSDRA
jgi:hypothetical protein